MRPPSSVTKKKRQLALSYWSKNPDATGRDVNERIKEKFGTHLNLGILYQLQREAKESTLAAGPPPRIPSNGNGNGISLSLRTRHEDAQVSTGGVTYPPSVIKAVNALLSEMRGNRIEAINIHANGKVSVKKLETKESEIHFGGRRANDQEPSAVVAAVVQQ